MLPVDEVVICLIDITPTGAAPNKAVDDINQISHLLKRVPGIDLFFAPK
jgi:hypothetical protein